MRRRSGSSSSAPVSLVGDGIGHVAFAGVAAGLLLDVSPVLSALVAAVLGAVALEWLGRAAGRSATGRWRSSSTPGSRGASSRLHGGRVNVDLFAYLFGSILTVTRADFVVVAGLGVVSLATVLVLSGHSRGDPRRGGRARRGGARGRPQPPPRGARGGHDRRLHADRGSPARGGADGAARHHGAAGGTSLLSALAVSLAIGLAAALGGVSVAYYADLPPGGSIVLLAAAAYVLAAAGAWLRRA